MNDTLFASIPMDTAPQYIRLNIVGKPGPMRARVAFPDSSWLDSDGVFREPESLWIDTTLFALDTAEVDTAYTARTQSMTEFVGTWLALALVVGALWALSRKHKESE